MSSPIGTSTPTFWLRAASIVALLFAAGHTLGAPWTPATGADAAGVVGAMQSLHFAAMGSDATYWGFYFGFGLCIACYLLALAVITWQIASLARSEAPRLRPIIVTLAALYTAIAVLSWMYFFIAPLILSAIVVACLLMAFGRAGRDRSAPIRER
jgi:hypothetical protein